MRIQFFFFLISLVESVARFLNLIISDDVRSCLHIKSSQVFVFLQISKPLKLQICMHDTPRVNITGILWRDLRDKEHRNL